MHDATILPAGQATRLHAIDDYEIPEGRRWLREYNSRKCSKCLVRYMEQCTFPDFIDKLAALWREHEREYRIALHSSPRQLIWFYSLLRAIETPRFRIIELPNGEWSEIDLRRVRHEHLVRQSPWRVIRTHSRCRCSERRHLIDAFLADSRQRAAS